ncbi:under-developed [Haematobia irritans]|uniref:under-developed n=1 Tax=Haematobia irritans TaxID=7368 RepID=UPI003F501DBA
MEQNRSRGRPLGSKNYGGYRSLIESNISLRERGTVCNGSFGELRKSTISRRKTICGMEDLSYQAKGNVLETSVPKIHGGVYEEGGKKKRGRPRKCMNLPKFDTLGLQDSFDEPLKLLTTKGQKIICRNENNCFDSPKWPNENQESESSDQKKKRGRPRKYPVLLDLIHGINEQTMPCEENDGFPLESPRTENENKQSGMNDQKKKRGRPRKYSEPPNRTRRNTICDIDSLNTQSSNDLDNTKISLNVENDTFGSQDDESPKPSITKRRKTMCGNENNTVSFDSQRVETENRKSASGDKKKTRGRPRKCPDLLDFKHGINIQIRQTMSENENNEVSFESLRIEAENKESVIGDQKKKRGRPRKCIESPIKARRNTICGIDSINTESSNDFDKSRITLNVDNIQSAMDQLERVHMEKSPTSISVTESMVNVNKNLDEKSISGIGGCASDPDVQEGQIEPVPDIPEIKKRGRPRKFVRLQTIANPLLSNNDSLELQTENSEEASPKKRRGRPRKNQTINDTINISKSGNGEGEIYNDALTQLKNHNETRVSSRLTGSKQKQKIENHRPFRNQSFSEMFRKHKKPRRLIGNSKEPRHILKVNGSSVIFPVRHIPRKCLEDSLNKLNNFDDPIWEEKNTSCLTSIHRYLRPQKCGEIYLKFKYARQFLVRRDWANLAKILSLIAVEAVDRPFLSSLLIKYIALCLAHADKEQFNSFLHMIINTKDGASVLRKCTQFNAYLNDET